ncbi:hypothetical protein Tco_0162332 [Tanacetum coccineum]
MATLNEISFLGMKLRIYKVDEGTAQVDEGTAKDMRKYCFYSKVLLIMLKVLLVVKVPLLCSKVLLVSSEKLVYTASFVRYRTERNFWFSDVVKTNIRYSAYFRVGFEFKCFVLRGKIIMARIGDLLEEKVIMKKKLEILLF